MGPIQTEEDLRYWLVNEDWYMSRHTREWLEATPADEAADLLARVAQDAQPEPRSAWSMFITGFASAGFAPSNAIAGAGPNNRKSGIRAAVMLGNQGDFRALVPLLRVFEPDPRWQNKYQRQIADALIELLSAAPDAESRRFAPEIRALADRIWRFGAPKRDLPDPLTDVLLAALRWLAAIDPSAAEAVLVASAETPNRSRVRASLQRETETV